MTDLTIIGYLTRNDETGFELTESTGKTHWITARKSLCDEIAETANSHSGNISVKIKGYIDNENRLVASKAYVLLGEE